MEGSDFFLPPAPYTFKWNNPWLIITSPSFQPAAKIVRAIPFEKLVGGCLVQAFRTTPPIFWFFLEYPAVISEKVSDHLAAISTGQVRPPPTLQFHFLGVPCSDLKKKKIGGYNYKMGMGGKIDYPTIVGWSGCKITPQWYWTFFQTTPQWYRNHSQTMPRQFFSSAPDTPPLTFQME